MVLDFSKFLKDFRLKGNSQRFLRRKGTIFLKMKLFIQKKFKNCEPVKQINYYRKIAYNILRNIQILLIYENLNF